MPFVYDVIRFYLPHTNQVLSPRPPSTLLWSIYVCAPLLIYTCNCHRSFVHVHLFVLANICMSSSSRAFPRKDIEDPLPPPPLLVFGHCTVLGTLWTNNQEKEWKSPLVNELKLIPHIRPTTRGVIGFSPRNRLFDQLKPKPIREGENRPHGCPVIIP